MFFLSLPSFSSSSLYHLERKLVSSTPSVISTVTHRRVFVSASHADDTFVARLTADLQQRGITASIEDPDRTQHTLEQEDEVRQAIRAADVVLLVVSPHARSSRTVKEHLRIASLYQRRLVFMWTAGEEIADVLPEEWGKTVQVDLVDAREGRYEQALDELMACLEEDEVSSEEPSLTTPDFEPRNPYKGLRAFTQDDATDFFGRDRLIEELVDRMKSMLTPGQPGTPPARLLTVIGPSGSGKSSVVMAGLLPQLQRGALPGSQQWVYLESMVPGTHPLEALTLTLAAHFPDRSVKSIREDLEDESARGLHLLTTQLVKAPGQKVMLLIDQFEELFTLRTSEEERQHFIDLLVTAMTETYGSVIVLLTLRADFYDRPLSYPSLSRLIVRQQVVVEPMDVHDLRAVIKRPAMLPDVQLSFEGSLVGDLLFEVRGQAGALPLLQFTLEQLFERRSGHTLTVQAYQEIGGVKGALAKHAEDTYRALSSEEHRKLARALFLRLIEPGITDQDTTRRRATLSELTLPTPKETELLQQVITYFLAARLLTTNEIAGTSTIEVSHEALIREWERLSDWLREAREDIHLLQAISKDATEWQRRDKPSDRLYRGSQLREAKKWAQRNIPSKNEIAFLQASAAQRTRVLLSIVVVVLVLLSTSGVAGWFLTRPDQTHVTNLNDHGPGSLRSAIDDAPSGSTITFDPSLHGTIQLTSGNLNIGKNLTVLGPGADKLAISSTRSYVIHVIPKVSASISNLAFKNSKITFEDTGSLFDSFIYNEGTLSLSNSIVSGNKVSSNSSSVCGGGIYNSGNLSLTNTIVTSNSVFASHSISGESSTTICGGGIFNDTGARLSLTNSMVSDNKASGGTTLFICAGGIFSSGTLTLTNSTVSGNSASAGGAKSDCSGGIYNDQGSLTITNSTISGNTTVYDGGGMVNYGGQIALTFCTIYGNKAHEAGGIATVDTKKSNGNTSVRSSILAGNIAPNVPDVSGNLTSLGYNVIGNLSGATLLGSPTVLTTDKKGVSTDALKIDPHLQDNGGLVQPHTWTHALLPGSPAIDLIPSNVCFSFKVPYDQRGVKRPQGKGCDREPTN